MSPHRQASREDLSSSYTSPSGFYSVEFPAGWRISRQENILNLYPPWGTGAVTVSAFKREGDEPVPLTDLLRKAFMAARPLSELVAVQTNGWNSYQQEYLTQEAEGELEWIAIAAEKDQVFALITSFDLTQVMPVRRPAYLRVLYSLEILPPG
jgi:hypothetical protein